MRILQCAITLEGGFAEEVSPPDQSATRQANLRNTRNKLIGWLMVFPVRTEPLSGG